MAEPPQHVWDKLVANTPPGESPLQTFLNGYLDEHFRWEISTYIGNRAHEFLQLNVDGSHNLLWQEYHTDYKCIHENQTEKILQNLGISKEDFKDFCAWLQADAEASGSDTLGLDPFLRAVTASEDYSGFLEVMFAEARRQQAQAQGQPVELEVPLPDGSGPGQTIVVEYLGTRYEVTVPEGVQPGGTFRAHIILA